MTDPDTISADYTLRPSDLAATLALLVEARQPCVVWGPPGAAKSMIAQQVAADAGRAQEDLRTCRYCISIQRRPPGVLVWNRGRVCRQPSSLRGSTSRSSIAGCVRPPSVLASFWRTAACFLIASAAGG